MEYKDTIRLPKTDFPMRAELPKREPSIQEQWEKAGLYSLAQEKAKNRPVFHLHDGPPFANGDAHMGHALNITLKDLVLKSKMMDGYLVPFVPGWDCHGLPIEHKVMKELADKKQGGGVSLQPGEIRKRCKAYAEKYIDIQRGQFKRLGVFGAWEKPYLTMDAAYEADILRVFAAMVEKGLVYQDLRPVYWSTGCMTALAEAEVEYQDRTDSSVYVKFPLLPGSSSKLGSHVGNDEASILIWTTTPWTLPANLAIAAHPEMDYVLAKAGDEKILLAKSLLEPVAAKGGRTLEILAEYKGGDLSGMVYRHPFLGREGSILLAPFVTGDSGTGFVHIAPGHGQDDYVVGKSNGLKPLSPVDDRGCLTDECGVTSLVGLNVFKANAPIIEMLSVQGSLWAQENHLHSYPHCWRSKTPIVFRSVTQWFIKVDAFRIDALAAIDQVEWVPAWGKNRIRGAVETRPDWCISRQRTWGVPIPAFYDEKGKPLLDATIIRKFADLVESKGTDLWFDSTSEELVASLGLPAGLKKGTDTLDVWIDSGSSHEAVCRKRLAFPADLYLEGSDQHRGWFQSSLLTSVAVNAVAPYKQVLTNGFVVDLESRKKLSKSSGKPIDLMTLVNQYGADVLRLWVASQDYRNDVPFSEEIFKHVGDTYRSIRNTLRILLANLEDFDAAKDMVPENQLHEIDLYMLWRFQQLVTTAVEAYRRYDFSEVYHSINRFVTVDISALYVDVLKDRLYCDALDSPKRRSSQTVMHEVFEGLCKLVAPMIAYTAEEAWQFAAKDRSLDKDHFRLVRESVHLQTFPVARKIDVPEQFSERWRLLIEVRDAANIELEKLRADKTIGKSLEAELEITSDSLSPDDAELLEELFLISSLKLKSGGEFSIAARKAPGQRCARCWKIKEDCGSHAEHPELCGRCTAVVTARDHG